MRKQQMDREKIFMRNENNEQQNTKNAALTERLHSHL